MQAEVGLLVGLELEGAGEESLAGAGAVEVGDEVDALVADGEGDFDAAGEELGDEVVAAG